MKTKTKKNVSAVEELIDKRIKKISMKIILL